MKPIQKILLPLAVTGVTIFLLISPFEEFINKLITFKDNYPQESIWMHTNKPTYVEGEDIWFTAYVADRDLHIPSTASNLFYTKLVDEDGKVLERKLYPIRNGVAIGTITIPGELKSNELYLIGNTSLYKADSTQHVFKRAIRVQSADENEHYINLSFSKGEYAYGDLVEVYLTVLDNEGQFASDITLDWEIDHPEKSGSLQTDVEGRADLTFTLDNDYENKTAPILIVSDVLTGKRYKWIVPIQSNTLRVSLFPEGGNAIRNQFARVAFKATDELDNPIDVTGFLLSSRGDTVAKYESYHQGMGSFWFQPVGSFDYEAHFRSKNGLEQIVPIKSIKKDGIGLNIVPNDSSITVNIQPGSSSEFKSTYLTISLGREPIWVNQFNLKDKTLRFDLDSDSLPSSLLRFTLFDKNLNPFAERMAFVNPQKQLDIEVDGIYDEMIPTEPVNMLIRASKPDGTPASDASVSVRVFDKNQSYDEDEMGIISGLLLSPELIGKIPTPEFYFENDSDSAKRALDLLAMTHGWRRIDWSAIRDGLFLNQEMPNSPEPIAGRLIRPDYEAVEGATISIIDVNNGYGFYRDETDSSGYFQFPLALPVDSTMFKIGIEENGEFDIEFFEYAPIQFEGDLPTLSQYSQYSIGQNVEISNRPTYTDFESIQLLDEIVVTAERSVKKADNRPPDTRTIRNVYITRSVSGQQLVEEGIGSGAGEGIMTMINYAAPIRNRRFIEFKQERDDDTSLDNEITFVLNGKMVFNLESLNWIRPFMVERIDVYRDGTKGLYPFEGTGGLIEIITLDYTKIQGVSRAQDKALFDTLLYDVPRQYYQPLLSEFTDAGIPDTRSSIYWNPQVKLNEDGEALLQFRLSENETEFIVNAEGFSLFGMGSIKRKVITKQN